MKVIQISDTHLFSDDKLIMFGIKSNIKFDEVIAKIKSEDIHDADMIFLTGDISQDRTSQSYQKIASVISDFNIPIYWIPGNHDNLEKMNVVFKNTKNFNRVSQLELSSWHFIFLDTQIEGRDDGYLSSLALNILNDNLKKIDFNKNIGIIMHHHPAPVGTPLIDNYILRNAKEFWDVVLVNKVNLIVCGHVHGDYRFKNYNTMIESSPATCLQWEKGTHDLKIDYKIGYKVYHFNQDGYQAVAKMW